MSNIKIPRAICLVVGEVLANRGSHDILNKLFESSGAPGPPPDLAHHSKWKNWLFTAGTDPNVDSLKVLGKRLRGTEAKGDVLKYSNNSIGRSFGTLLDKLICQLNLERVLGRLSNQYFKASPIRHTTLPKYCFLGIKSFSYLFRYI
ncbi:MAG: hypothetical protein U9R02_06250 [Thermodesulfobacteriota bacterium]|nr:hypothetical protein [Thermodesulfobacteriota bacterium]